MKTKTDLLNKNRIKRLFLLIFFFSFFYFGNGNEPSTISTAQIEKLLSSIDLEQPGLEKIKQSQNNPEQAISELLNYYKTRTSVKHPIQTNLETYSEKDLKYADDAIAHIFVGQPAYPSHFCGNDINWNARPVPDNEWVWQLNRMYFWNAMAKVYTTTNDEKYAKAWAEQLIDWTRKNPRDKEHDYAWRSIEAGIRGFNWTNHFYSFLNSPHFTPEVLVAFLNSLHEHAEFLMTVYRSKSNWGLMEAEGLAFIAINFPEFRDAEKWKKEAFRRLNNEINLQVYPDGHQRELAIGYHVGCINWFYRTYELAKLNGIEKAFPESYINKIEKMCEVPLKIGFPDGTNVQFGDAWRGSPGQYSERFLTWAEMFNRDDFLFLATKGAKGNKPKSTAFAFPESGIYSLRSGWDTNAICFVLKCGPDGGGHCQPDNGTFSLYAGGRNLMPDAGSYIYSGNPEWRNWFRQTNVHQTLTLNNENSNYNPQLIKWEPGENLDLLVVENKSYENLTHRRGVIFVDKEYFVVLDKASGTAAGNIDIHFQFAPGEAIFNLAEYSVSSGFSEGWNVLVQTQTQNNLELSEEEGWVSFEYTKKIQRPAFRYRLKKDSKDESVEFITVIAPFQKDKPRVEINVKKEHNQQAKINKITKNGKKKN